MASSCKVGNEESAMNILFGKNTSRRKAPREQGRGAEDGDDDSVTSPLAWCRLENVSHSATRGTGTMGQARRGNNENDENSLRACKVSTKYGNGEVAFAEIWHVATVIHIVPFVFRAQIPANTNSRIRICGSVGSRAWRSLIGQTASRAARNFTESPWPYRGSYRCR